MTHTVNQEERDLWREAISNLKLSIDGHGNIRSEPALIESYRRIVAAVARAKQAEREQNRMADGLETMHEILRRVESERDAYKNSLVVAEKELGVLAECIVKIGEEIESRPVCPTTNHRCEGDCRDCWVAWARQQAKARVELEAGRSEG